MIPWSSAQRIREFSWPAPTSPRSPTSTPRRADPMRSAEGVPSAKLEKHTAPTVAAINGSCSGGGFDLILACDALVAGPGARLSHPGIRRGLVTGWTGTTSLPSALGSAIARAVLLETRQLDPLTLSNHGAVLSSAEDPIGAAIETARRMASLDPVRWRLWRTLRGPGFIDRFHAFVVHKL